MREVKATFHSGDILTLKMISCTFEGYKPCDLYELSYGECYKSDGKTLYKICGVQYFHVNISDIAKIAFSKRLSYSDSRNLSHIGNSLDSFLVKIV